jgi:hypothetical protein
MQGGKMRFQELFEDRNEIEKLLKNYFTIDGTITIDSDNKVNISGHCTLKEAMGELPVNFGKVYDFFCNSNALMSLKGAPESIGNTFSCGANNLISLEGSPERVGGSFSCHSNQLTSLIGAPKIVGGTFNCCDNPLKSLEGFPEKLNGFFICDWTSELPLLRSLQAKQGVTIYYGFTAKINERVTDIINKFIGHTNLRHAILDCQKELTDAGFAGNARW